MESPSILLIIVRIGFVLGILGLGQRKHWALDLSILGAATALGASYLIHPLKLASIMVEGCWNSNMLALLLAVLSILAFSGLLDASGQTHRLTENIRTRIHSPKVRLAFFPALIGLLPMPGGAIFSCPMVKEVSASMPINGMHKALVNVWFRHIWETTWPLYPGLVLACLLGELPPYTYGVNCFIVTISATVVGWYLYLRKIPQENKAVTATEKAPMHSILCEGLPILISLGLSCILYMIFPHIPAGYCFGIGFFVGIIVCLVQNHLPVREVSRHCFTKKNFRMLTILVTIFALKNVLNQCGLIAEMGEFAKGNPSFLIAACIILPLISGILTGILIGAVGVSFPVILELLQQANLWDERGVWLALTVAMCYIGEMLSPVHICLVLSSEYFKVQLGDLLKNLLIPTGILVVFLGIFYGIFIAF